MTESAETPRLCRECGTPLIDAYLTGPVDPVRIRSMRSFEGSDVQALVCPECGLIELRAETPWKLAQQDIRPGELPGS